MYVISFNVSKVNFNLLGYELVDNSVSLHDPTGWEKQQTPLCKWCNDLEEALKHYTINAIPIVIVLGKTEPCSLVFIMQ
jgi:hypothetical protein